MTPEQIEQLRADYSAGPQAVKAWAAKLGVTIQAVYWQMERHGISRRRGGDASKGTQAGTLNPNWKDGTTKRKDGYILERRDGRQLFQHRIVAERNLGRPLKRGEVVHHIDGDKSNNSPANLEVLASHAEHMKEHCDSETMRARGSKGNRVRHSPPSKPESPNHPHHAARGNTR